MDKQVIMLVLVVMLAVMSGVQAYQISDLRSDVSDGTVSISGAVVNTPSGGSAPRQQAAPTMVGGC